MVKNNTLTISQQDLKQLHIFLLNHNSLTNLDFIPVDELILNFEIDTEGKDNETILKEIKEKVIWGKEDIMKLFNVGSAKALGILKIMYIQKLALQLGNGYYTTPDYMIKFFENNVGTSMVVSD